MFDVFIGTGFPTIAVLFLPDLGRDFHQSVRSGRLVVAALLRFFKGEIRSGMASVEIFKYDFPDVTVVMYGEYFSH